MVTLTREIIKVRSVNSRAEGDNVGYLRITEFNDLTNDELKSAITDLSTKIPADQMKGYILDLRNNPAVSSIRLSRCERLSEQGRDRIDTRS